MRLLARILICLGIGLWLVANTLRWQHALEGYEARFTPALELPGADKPIFLSSDSYEWLSHAQRMASTGEWRIRHTDIDNAPYGRAMHWSQSIAWLELLAGKIRSAITGEPWLAAIPRAAIWVNPAIFAACLCLLFLLLEARAGFVPAALAVVWMLSVGDIGAAFHPYLPDHQSLHLAFSLAACLLLLCGGAGWVSDVAERRGFRCVAEFAPPVEGAARWYFLASGVAGGLALWVGATVEAICLGMLIAGAGSAALFFRRDGAAGKFVPGLYRVWGRALAVTSLLMFVVEYFPGDIAWRLEVNHPLYALAGLAAAELLAAILELREAQRFPRALDWAWLFALVCGIALLPAVIFFGGAAVHAMRDPEMMRLHSFINEFHPYASFYDTRWPVALFANFIVLPLFAPAALACAIFAKGNPAHRAVLWTTGVLALGMLGLAIFQQRWIGFYAQFSVVALALSLPVFLRLPNPHVRIPAFVVTVAALTAVAVCLFVQQGRRLANLRAGVTLDQPVVREILVKRLAVQLAAQIGTANAHLMAEPGL
ncbi:MAG: hypothetical protein ACREKL_04825, partial [Chthoniobacterales bacterium]